MTGCMILYAAVLFLRRKEGQVLTQQRRLMPSLLLRSYALWVKLPLLRHYVIKVRSRLTMTSMNDEFQLQRQTMKLTYSLFLTVGSMIILLTILNPNPVFLLSLLLVTVVIQDLVLESYVNAMQVKLLDQMLDFLAAVRHAYQRHEMVADAIEEAGNSLAQDMGRHAYRIADVLTDSNPDEMLEKYYSTAPNRFLKAFAGISRLVMEYGDRKTSQGSLYLRGIASLTGEIQLELLKRRKLDYLLKGLHIIALVPIFFTKPIEMWARRNFPLMDPFYLSKTGMIIKVSIFLIIFISYILLQKLKGQEETGYRSNSKRHSWEARLYRAKSIRRVIRIFTPSSSSVQHYRISQLLKETNHHLLHIELFQVRRLTLFVLGFVFTLGTVLTMHSHAKHRITIELPAGYTFFGTISKEDEITARQASEMDAEIMRDVKMSASSSPELLEQSVKSHYREQERRWTDEEISADVQRIRNKLNLWNREFLKWWEALGALIIGVAFYYAPVGLLRFQRRLRLPDMKYEVYQFLSMIAILREMERISVEEILEWLHTYAVIFKGPLQKCLLNYGHGAEEALREMREEVQLGEFQRMTDKLILASEKLMMADAFDDLDSDMAYHFERRRLDYEKDLDMKAGLGRMIGFIPMYSLVFAYLVIPLIWMSFKQMDLYFEQIQKL